jgi:hypothetical protein
MHSPVSALDVALALASQRLTLVIISEEPAGGVMSEMGPRAEVPFLPVTRIISEAQGSYPMGRFALSLCCRDRISAQRA